MENFGRQKRPLNFEEEVAHPNAQKIRTNMFLFLYYPTQNRFTKEKKSKVTMVTKLTHGVTEEERFP